MSKKNFKIMCPRPKGSKNKPSYIKEKNKVLFLETLRENYGILKPALEVAAITRFTFNQWYNADPEFRLKVDEVREEAIDLVESQLISQIKKGGAAQTIFYLKTKGKSRGYIETTETNMSIDTVRIKYILPDGSPIENQLFSNEHQQLETTPIIQIEEPKVTEKNQIGR